MTCRKCGAEVDRCVREMCRSCYDRWRYLSNIVYFRVYYQRHRHRIRAHQLQYQRQRPLYFVDKRREYAEL